MKKIEFKQNDLKRGVPFAIIYLVAVFLGCYFYFGGMIGMADAVNNFGSAKGIGLLVGLVVLAPFLIILNFLMPKILIELDSEKIRIFKNKKEQNTIYYSEISKLQLNVSNINRLDFLDANNNVLFHVQPQNNSEVLNEIISEINKHIVMTKQVGTKSYFGKNIDTVVFIRK